MNKKMKCYEVIFRTFETNILMSSVIDDYNMKDAREKFKQQYPNSEIIRIIRYN